MQSILASTAVVIEGSCGPNGIAERMKTADLGAAHGAGWMAVMAAVVARTGNSPRDEKPKVDRDGKA